MDLLELFDKYNPRQLSSGEIQMQCPFRERHDVDSQRRRQMWVNPDKNLYHCFSCHSKGTAISLLTTKFSVSLSDAVDFIHLRFVDTVALEPYEDIGKEKFALKEYLPDFVLNWDVVPIEFLERGFSEKVLRSFFVGVNTVDGESTITIPMIDSAIGIVGIKFRKPRSKEFWYSSGFMRRNFIYNKPKNKARIVVVESETDTFRSVTNGIAWTGATLGTEMTILQARQLAEYGTVYLAYDNDHAGYMATEKAYHKLKGMVEDLRFVIYSGEDPGACKSGDWTSAITGAVDYPEYSYIMHSIIGEEYGKIQKEAKRLLKIK